MLHLSKSDNRLQFLNRIDLVLRFNTKGCILKQT